MDKKEQKMVHWLSDYIRKQVEKKNRPGGISGTERDELNSKMIAAEEFMNAIKFDGILDDHSHSLKDIYEYIINTRDALDNKSTSFKTNEDNVKIYLCESYIMTFNRLQREDRLNRGRLIMDLNYATEFIRNQVKDANMNGPINKFRDFINDMINEQFEYEEEE